mgnify:CR=1 FL=1
MRAPADIKPKPVSAFNSDPRCIAYAPSGQILEGFPIFIRLGPLGQQMGVDGACIRKPHMRPEPKPGSLAVDCIKH